MTAFTATGVPVEELFTTLTVRGPDAFVVEDAWTDPRIAFRTLVRFYAGYPISAPDGTMIGALSVFDSQSRAATTIDTGFLRQLAHDIENQLQAHALSGTAPAA